MKSYYLIENGQQVGPFSLEDIKTKNLSKESKVWMEGLENWVNAEDIAEIKPILSKTPPPIPQKEAKTPPPIPQIKTAKPPDIGIIPNQENMHFGYELVGAGGRFGAVLIESLILAVPIYLLEQLNFVSPFVIAWMVTSFLAMITYPLYAGNIGHRILGYKVISAKDGKDCKSIDTGLYRELLKYVMSFVIIPIIWLLFDKNTQNLYDIILGTYVVKGKINK